MATDTGKIYDEYWRSQELERLRARTEARVALALELLSLSSDLSPRENRRPRLLDIGCGLGWSLEAFVKAGYDASGIDVSSFAVQELRARGLRAEVHDLEKQPLTGEYEILVALEVLEHLAFPLPILLQMKQALADGGRIVVSLPNEFHLLRRLQILFGMAPIGGHDDPHLRYFHGRLADRLFDHAELRIAAQKSDIIVPPRYRLLRKCSAPFMKMLPGLFAIANVYLLAPDKLAPLPQQPT